LERTVQEYGVLVDNIHYYADVLRSWIHAMDPDHPKLKRKFIFARDPRDISTLYFLDPELKTYFPIPYRDTSRRAISLWELRAVMTRLAEQGVENPNEEIIFDGIQKMREIEREAKEKTKGARAARRNSQRRKGWVKAAAAAPQMPAAPLVTVDDGYSEDAEAFSDIQESE